MLGRAENSRWETSQPWDDTHRHARTHTLTHTHTHTHVQLSWTRIILMTFKIFRSIRDMNKTIKQNKVLLCYHGAVMIHDNALVHIYRYYIYIVLSDYHISKELWYHGICMWYNNFIARVCMYVWMYECMHVCMNVFMYECMNVWMYELYECMNECMYVFMYVCMNVWIVWMYEWMSVCMYVWINEYEWMNVWMNEWMYVCMNECIHTYILYIYIYINFLLIIFK